MKRVLATLTLALAIWSAIGMSVAWAAPSRGAAGAGHHVKALGPMVSDWVW